MIIKTLTFTDQGTKDSLTATVRGGDGTVGLAISLQDAGDYEVFLKAEVCSALIKHLGEALHALKT